MIVSSDHEIIKAFLRRESEEYKWKEGIDGPAANKFREETFKDILSQLEKLNVACDYICIQSLTNMGLVSAELRLSAANLDYKQDVHVFLPPSPRGKIGIHIHKKK